MSDAPSNSGIHAANVLREMRRLSCMKDGHNFFGLPRYDLYGLLAEEHVDTPKLR